MYALGTHLSRVAVDNPSKGCTVLFRTPERERGREGDSKEEKRKIFHLWRILAGAKITPPAGGERGRRIERATSPRPARVWLCQGGPANANRGTEHSGARVDEGSQNRRRGLKTFFLRYVSWGGLGFDLQELVSVFSCLGMVFMYVCVLFLVRFVLRGSMPPSLWFCAWIWYSVVGPPG